MAQVKLPTGITRISGKVGNMCFRTMKASGKVFVGSLPHRRTTRPTAGEMEARERFSRKARLVNAMRQAGSRLTQKELWKLAEQAL